MKRYSFLCLAAAGLFSGCSSVSVSRDFDSTFDFSSLKTFTWEHETQPETGVPRIDNDLNDKRIRAAIETNLKAKGFTIAEAKETADFRVAYFVDFQQRIEGGGSSFSVGMGRGTASRAGAVGWSTGTNVSDYEEGQLTIDFLDPKTGDTIWRGVGRRRTSSSSDPEKLTQRTNDVVTRTLKKFPPK